MAGDSKDEPKKAPETWDEWSYYLASTRALYNALQHFRFDNEALRQSTYYVAAARQLLGGDASTREKQRELENQVADLRSQVAAKAEALEIEKHSSQEKERLVEELKNTLTELKQKERLNFLLSRVNPTAQRALIDSVDFQAKFLAETECDAFVVSVDIRRSTDLMLRARRAELFAAFITNLCNELIDSVLDCYGVIDKFTGDGILSFFPTFFTGPDAGYYVLLAADRCHKAFQAIYHKYRTAFSSVLKDTGLGIGIDFGTTRLVQMAGGLSVVGPAVVYACRMGGAPAGQTLLNQPAYERISERFSANCFFRETELEIKHEGTTLAYGVTLSKQAYQPTPPDWCSQPAAGHVRGEVVQTNPSSAGAG
jgi:class 3 adenylate cyclase